MSDCRLTRRALLGSTFSLMLFQRPGRAGGRGQDRGIGGTGHIADLPEDRGIGGTGVIGTIRRFGSIIVNGMRISYPRDVEVEIDGLKASAADLRIGQVVGVAAEPTPTGFTTRRIVVASEVIGPIEAIASGALTVLGQSVATGSIHARGWKRGQWIAVAGLRRIDGTIVASHIQARDDSIARVSGPVTLTSEGAAKIGGLVLANLDPALAGQRVMADVGRIDGAPAAASAIVNPQLAALSGMRRLLIEDYVERSGEKQRFGSGLTAQASAAANVAPASGPVRAIIAVTVNSDGSLTATGQKPAQEPEPSQPDRTTPRPAEQQPASEKSAPADAKATEMKSVSAPQPAEPKPAPEPAAKVQERSAPPPPPPPPSPPPEPRRK